MKIGITGVSGYIGQMLLGYLEEDPEVTQILGIDINPSPKILKKLEFIKKDIRSKELVNLFRELDVLVHLAFIVEPVRDKKVIYDINVKGSINVLKACEECSIPQIVVASSIAAYGIIPKGTPYLEESTPLKGNARSYYAHTKRLMEEELDKFEKRNPGVVITKLRPSVLMGPVCYNFSHEFFAWPFMIDRLGGAKLPIVHEQDAVKAFYLALKKKRHGAFNISIPEPVPVTIFAALIGKKRIPLPNIVIRGMLSALWELRISKFSPDWAALLIYSHYPSIRIERARKDLGWEPHFVPKETIQSQFKDSKLTFRDIFRKKEFPIGGIHYR